MRTLLLALVVGTLVPTFARPAVAQHTTEKHPEIGVAKIQVPRTFEAVPVQPGERMIKLQWVEEIREGRRAKERKIRPELQLIVLDREGPTTPGGEDAPQDDPRWDDPGTFEDYARRRLRMFDLDTDEDEAEQDGEYVLQEWALTPENPRHEYVGWAYTWTSARQCVGVIGICHQDDLEEMVKLWSKTGEKLKLSEVSANEYEARKWERYYRQKRLSHPEYRIGVRQAMVEPWQAEDTENYIVVFNTTDQPLVRKILRDLEAVRLEYMERFPPVGEFDAVSTVRVCKDRDEYLAYGGMPRSAGYWNWQTEELVLYDASKQEKGERPDDSDTFIVLYHEAFHQYIHYSAGQLAPHSWFNEGYGDFFSGATITGGKVRSVDVNPWRAWLIQACVREELEEQGAEQLNGFARWKDIIRWDQATYYANGSRNYAQGWSMIYFLNTSPEVEARPEWKKILPTYFQTLKTVFAKEMDELGNPEKPFERAPAEHRAREAAVDAAFEGVDVDELEKAWLKFVEELVVPERD